MTDLRASYAACRHVNATHGRTFHLATRLLPATKRPAIHALYAFARYADDIVDSTLPLAQRTTLLDSWAQRFFAGCTDDPLLPAVHDTIARYRIPTCYFHDFLASMRMDLTVSRYPTYDALQGYMHGSAAVIGLQTLAVLGTIDGAAGDAAPYAAELGVAFQLTNFVRDVGEDYRRGRIYLPQDEMAAFDVTDNRLGSGVVDDQIRQLLAFQIARARRVFQSAEPGIALLDPASRDCVRTAYVLYGGILDAVEAAGYQVLDRRVAVSRPRRAAVALRGLARAQLARTRIGGRSTSATAGR